jgi:hypothetical protein
MAITSSSASLMSTTLVSLMRSGLVGEAGRGGDFRLKNDDMLGQSISSFSLHELTELLRDPSVSSRRDLTRYQNEIGYWVECVQSKWRLTGLLEL